MPHTHTTAVTLNRTRWKLGQLGRQNPRVRRQQAYACRVRCREPALVNPKPSPTVGWHCETTWAAIRGPKQNGAEPPAGKKQWSKGQSVKPRLQSWSRLEVLGLATLAVRVQAASRRPHSSPTTIAVECWSLRLWRSDDAVNPATASSQRYFSHGSSVPNQRARTSHSMVDTTRLSGRCKVT